MFFKIISKRSHVAVVVARSLPSSSSLLLPFFHIFAESRLFYFCCRESEKWPWAYLRMREWVSEWSKCYRFGTSLSSYPPYSLAAWWNYFHYLESREKWWWLLLLLKSPSLISIIPLTFRTFIRTADWTCIGKLIFWLFSFRNSQPR